MRAVPFLMYHELLAPGMTPAAHDAGYTRYVLTADTFRQHLEILRELGCNGTDVTGALTGDLACATAITFDDGCLSDLLVAAPALTEFGFRATFYVTVAHLGRPGYLTQEQLRELASQFEIGSHGMTHSYMDELSDAQVRSQLADSRAMLQDLTDHAVMHFSCPGGRWTPAVGRLAREIGYATVTDSRPVSFSPGSDPWRIGRYAVTTSVQPAHVRSLAESGRWAGAGMRYRILSTAKGVLGNRLYDGARGMFLRMRGG